MSPRSEHDIFRDLGHLCTSTGFIHAVAAFCFRDTFLLVADDLTPGDLDHTFAPERLIRTEITTLIGLLLRGPIDYSVPNPDELLEYLRQTEQLLQELHEVLAGKLFQATKRSSEDGTPVAGEAIREPIFYCAESAYSFQYREFFLQKYRNDASWLLAAKGFDLDVAREVAIAIPAILTEQAAALRLSIEEGPPPETTVLPAFTISYADLAARTSEPVERVRAVIDALAVPNSERNSTFESLTDFNSAYAYPIIKRDSNEFIVLQYFGFLEALYDGPFYWMIDDQSHSEAALGHRGQFVEELCSELLSRVFGSQRVFRNVELVRGKGNVLGEIDVLAVFADYAIVLQAKSKKLTLEGRKGNDRQLRSDFKLAVQDAVDQAYSCARLLDDPSVVLRSADGRRVPPIERTITAFPVSIVADHYPTLSLQVRQFLIPTSDGGICRPLVTDVFGLDAITEMISSPVMLLHYLTSRDMDVDLIASNELVLLSFYLKCGMKVDDEMDMVVLDDDLSAHLDVAMTVRRDQVPGVATPAGILTRFAGTCFQPILGEIDVRPKPAAVRWGLWLLDLAEEAIHELDDKVSTIMRRTRADGDLHDVTAVFSAIRTGITVHCSELTDGESEARLLQHCARRKQSTNADTWFGLAIRPDGSLRTVVEVTNLGNSIERWDHASDSLST